ASRAGSLGDRGRALAGNSTERGCSCGGLLRDRSGNGKNPWSRHCGAGRSERTATKVHDNSLRSASGQGIAKVEGCMSGGRTRVAAPRIAALWFPDWPIQAAQIEDSSLAGPIILVRHHRVEVCNREARAAGIKRGMRLRQAQALCSEAAVVDANEDRDGALFAAIVTS